MSCRETIVLGNVAVVQTYRPFADAETGEPLNPTSVYLTTKDPDGIETTYTYGVDSELSKPGGAVGHYRGEFVPDSAGEWVATLWSEGDGKAAAFTEFTVIEP